MVKKLKVPYFSINSSKSELAKDNNLIRFMEKNKIDTLEDLLLKSIENVDWYWKAVNEDLGIKWREPFYKVVEAQKGIPWCEWFVGGKCNIIDNVIQSNINKHPNKTAFIFVNQDGIKKELSFKELELRVNVFANALRDIGVKKGDVVGVYLPMRMESFVAIYAISKLGAVHVPIFSGFGKTALEQRLVDSNSSYLITSDSFQRRGRVINLRTHWEDALSNTFVKKIIVSETEESDSDHCPNDRVLSFKRIYDDALSTYDSNRKFEAELMESSDPLFILYTSGTTGKPKGTIQTHGGFSIFSAHQSAYLIDLKSTDTIFWYADIGWITGQTWIVYGSPIVGSTAVIFEDTLDFPSIDYWARQVDDLQVTIFGAAPTAIRQFMRNKIDFSKFHFSSLRLLVSTGERLNKEAWDWYFSKVGNNRCPIINLSGGTEIGGAILSMLPFLDNVPTSVGVPVPGLDVDILNDQGKSVDDGYLVIRNPWPGMTKGILNDEERYMHTYWSKFPNIWNHGDKVRTDSQNMWYISGRIDDIMKISGHRIDPSEIEEVLTSYSGIIESAAVGIPDAISGESVCIFCVMNNADMTYQTYSLIKTDLEKLLTNRIGKFLLPKAIYFVNELPKNRSGKILRRLIRKKLLDIDISKDDLLLVENPDSLESFFVTKL
ncbi:MAG: AMP-binding protein [Candidatus Nitrosocosmicus sp.]|nr:AMP-binding protein [Candidatus Nitrosocosmicus sp.]MDN5867066.1 AMP-binding protein [Candidatus Nitrosocosmicus sp.]